MLTDDRFELRLVGDSYSLVIKETKQFEKIPDIKLNDNNYLLEVMTRLTQKAKDLKARIQDEEFEFKFFNSKGELSTPYNFKEIDKYSIFVNKKTNWVDELKDVMTGVYDLPQVLKEYGGKLLPRVEQEIKYRDNIPPDSDLYKLHEALALSRMGSKSPQYYLRDTKTTKQCKQLSIN